MSDKYAVFGNPIEHSLSPLIHEYFAKQSGDDMNYGRILVKKDFASCADEFFEEGLGCNITVPFKQDAYVYATRLTRRAEESGAVNTLKKLDFNCFYGDNTDGDGLIMDLELKEISLKSANVLIIGAGGAARGIINPLMEKEVASLYVVSRTYEKSVSLVESMNLKGLRAISFERLNGSDMKFDIILNASSSSLNNELPDIKDECLKQAKCVYDLMYSKSGSTVFTDKAKQLCVEHSYDGLGMLICQAALSFELWRGKKADVQGAFSYMNSVLGR